MTNHELHLEQTQTIYCLYVSTIENGECHYPSKTFYWCFPDYWLLSAIYTDYRHVAARMWWLAAASCSNELSCSNPNNYVSAAVLQVRLHHCSLHCKWWATHNCNDQTLTLKYCPHTTSSFFWDIISWSSDSWMVIWIFLKLVLELSREKAGR